MASKLAKLEQDTITNSLEIVHHKVRLLMEVWKMFFDEICYLDYLTSLPSSIEQFLGEIYCLTMSFCVRKTQRMRELQAELFELRRVLGVSGDEPEDDWERGHMSLDRKLSQLQQRINTLRQQTEDRKRLMEAYTLEETELLNDLGEAAPPHEPLCPHPETGLLPDAGKMAQFGDYLSRLRAEKVKRIATRDKLQADIRQKAQILKWVPRKDRHLELTNEQLLIPSLTNLNKLQHLDFILSGLLDRKRQEEQQQTQQQQPQSQQQQPQPQSQPQKPPPKKPQQKKQPKTDQKQSSAPASAKQPEGQTTKQAYASPTRSDTIGETGVGAPPPPPPPSSPASEIDLPASSAASTTATTTSITATTANSDTGSLFEPTIETYMRLEAEEGRPMTREQTIEKIFQRVRACINLWWERCLISPDERLQCKVLYTDQLDEEAFVAHIEQQKLLQSYFDENEPIFRLINQWTDQWNQAVELQRAASPQNTAQLVEVNSRLLAIRRQLEARCREFEQRCQVKFTMFGRPVMQVLKRFQEKREPLRLPKSCKLQVIPMLPRVDAETAANQQQLEQATTGTPQELNELLVNLQKQKQKLPVEKETVNEEENEEEDEEDDDDDDEEEEESTDSDDSNHDGGDGDDGGSSDDGGEVNQKRDDELLEEAFASATAVTTHT
uniref:Uncharacterized protein n=1 Tax=Anopheles dirus TaxID=7168 RepID=A0A182N2K6_9DIPT